MCASVSICRGLCLKRVCVRMCVRVCVRVSAHECVLACMCRTDHFLSVIRVKYGVTFAAEHYISTSAVRTVQTVIAP